MIAQSVRVSSMFFFGSSNDAVRNLRKIICIESIFLLIRCRKAGEQKQLSRVESKKIGISKIFFEEPLCDVTGDKPAGVLFASFSQGRDLCVDVTVVNPLFDIYDKMKQKDKYLDEAVKQKNIRYAERCNAAGLNFMACAFETTGAICKEVTPLIDRIARNTAELSDIMFTVAKERIYQRLSFVLQKWNAHSTMKLDAVV